MSNKRTRLNASRIAARLRPYQQAALNALMKPAAPPVRDVCIHCDGTGQICDTCGENEYACECNDKSFSGCDTCGRGK